MAEFDLSEQVTHRLLGRVEQADDDPSIWELCRFPTKKWVSNRSTICRSYCNGSLTRAFIEVLINRGNLLQELDRPLEALASYNDALENAPGRADILNNRGSALLIFGRVQEAGMDFAKKQALHAVRSMTVFQKKRRRHSGRIAAKM